MLKEKSIIIIDKLIKAGIYILTFLMPLFFIPFNSEALEINKQILLVSLSVIMFVLWLSRVVVRSKISFVGGPLNIITLLFLVAYLVVSIFSKDRYQSLIGFSSTAVESFLTVLSLILLYFIVINNVQKIKFAKYLVLILILSIFIAALFSILQLSGIYPFAFWAMTKTVAFNTVGAHNALAILNGLAIILIVTSLMNKNISSYFKIALTIAGFALLFFTVSLKFWNVLIVLAIAMILILILTAFRREENLPRLLMVPMIIFGLTVIFYFTLIQPFSKNAQLAAQPLFKGLPTEILPSYKLTVGIMGQALKENMLLGSGPSTWIFDYAKFKPQEVNRVTDLWNVRFIRGWSYALVLPATIGLIGSLFWLAIILIFLIYAIRKIMALKEIQSSYGSLSLGLFIGWIYLIILQFIYPINMTLQFVFWLVMSLFVAISIIKETKENNEEPVKNVVIKYYPNSPMASIVSFVFVIIVVTTAIGLYFLGQFYYADIFYSRGINASNNQNLQVGVDMLEKSVFLNSHSDFYYRSLSQAYWLLIQDQAKKIPANDSNQAKQFQFLIDKMLTNTKKATDLSPNNIENWIQRARVYQGLIGFVSGSEDWSIKSYKEAIKLDPMDPSLHTELSRIHTLMAINDQSKKSDQLKQAEDEINRAIALKPDYTQAYILLALVYEQEGKIDEAISRMEKVSVILDTDPNALFQLGYLYMKQNKLDEAQSKLEKAVSLIDSFSNARYFLGLIYSQKDMRQAAIDQFGKILSLNPNNQEVKQILKNLNDGLPALHGLTSANQMPFSSAGL